MGKVAGCIISACWPRNASGASATFLPVARTFCRSSIVGKPCCHCQMTLGRKIARAAAAPSQIHGFLSSRRRGVARTATATAAPKNTVECLFWSPRPARAPKANHRRGLPPRIKRISR